MQLLISKLEIIYEYRFAIGSILVCICAFYYHYKYGSKHTQVSQPPRIKTPTTVKQQRLKPDPSELATQYNPEEHLVIQNFKANCIITKDKTEYSWEQNTMLIPYKFTNGLLHGICERQGYRDRMENSVGIIPRGCRNQCGFLMFDGHRGKEAAEFCVSEMAPIIANCIDSSSSNTNSGEDFTFDFDLSQLTDETIRAAIRDGFRQTDSQFREYATQHQCQAGAVGVFILISGCERVMYVANVGDCRVLLCRDGQSIPLYEEHHAKKNKQERERVGKHLNERTFRVCNELAVTRAIGDFEPPETCCASASASAADCDSNHNPSASYRKMDGLICDPFITKQQLTDKDEFLIIACDGLWEVLSEQVAVETVRKLLRRNPDCEAAAQALVNVATSRNTTDNVSVMVVAFADQNAGGDLQVVPPKKHIVGSKLRRSHKLPSARARIVQVPKAKTKDNEKNKVEHTKYKQVK